MSESNDRRTKAARLAELKAKVLTQVFPGKPVKIESLGIDAMVYPLGFCHLDQFSKDIVGMITSLMRIDTSKLGGMTKEAMAAAIAQHAVPIILESGVMLIDECVVIEVPGNEEFETVKLSIKDLPHWEAPALIEEWIIESFGTEDKWRPWLEAVNRVVRQVTNDQTFSILEMLSKHSLPVDTPSTTS